MTQSAALDNREIIEKAVIVLAGFVASGLLGLAASGSGRRAIRNRRRL